MGAHGKQPHKTKTTTSEPATEKTTTEKTTTETPAPETPLSSDGGAVTNGNEGADNGTTGDDE